MLCWIGSYLSRRRFRVRLAGRLSSEHGVSSRAPQGCNLGLLLFNIFTNDIAVGTSLSSDVFLYADVLEICAEVNSILDHDVLQHDIEVIEEWARINRMRLDTKKTAFISYNQNYTCCQVQLYAALVCYYLS